MRLKKGAKINGLKTEILIGLMIAKSVYNDRGHEFIITEGTGGKHMDGSKHYIGQAIDIRTRNTPAEQHESIRSEIENKLTDDFDVVLHSTHIHLEFDPK